MALQASSSATIEMPSGSAGGMSVTIASQVNMIYSQMSQGGSVDEQTMKALIMLMLVQLMLKGGFDDQTQQTLEGLMEAFKASGQSEMTMIAMQASSMVQIDMGGMGADMPVMALEASAGASLDILA